ncbi:hypothetical protein [Pantoea stewartii]|uniref:Uncharacterized protein n=1 Tax=Pantoea stewartii TaxID=66269 RepID=A0AB34VJZ0_9GAMM|nr:hypothetical protein [Pantoea stewartii]KTS71883.1 hypothetical protein RSA30_17005 [Pantoea stewartii]KTT00379.1 hypothetical protein RSA13_02975 [Pantoea stewartii]KTT09166.1 hypothetical protein RSA36_04440 [Pantoea stewartii]
MRIFFRTVPVAAINVLQSLNAGRAFKSLSLLLLSLLNYMFLLFMYLLKPVFLWPLIFLSAVMTLLMMAVPVLLFASPVFTLGSAFSGLQKIIDQIPEMWPVLILLSLQFDMLLFLRREYNREFTRMRDRLLGREIVHAGPGRGGDVKDKQRG